MVLWCNAACRYAKCRGTKFTNKPKGKLKIPIDLYIFMQEFYSHQILTFFASNLWLKNNEMISSAGACSIKLFTVVINYIM